MYKLLPRMNSLSFETSQKEFNTRSADLGTIHISNQRDSATQIGTQNCIIYSSPKFQSKRLGIWQVARRYLLIFSLVLLAACSPSEQKEFSAPFELSSFLRNQIQELPGQTVRFQILDLNGEPVPHGLLRFDWIEGGRMDFQTDQDGTISMQFEKDMLENEVIVFAKSERGKIKVTW